MKKLALSFLVCFAVGCTAEGLPENDGPDKMAAHEPSPPQEVNYEAQAPNSDQKAFIIGGLTGAATRFDGWANTFGTVNFGFNWSAIHAGSHVYVSASELDNTGARFNGSAAYTVQNIVVKEGRVEFRIVINWSSPIRVSTDILTIDP